MEDIILTRVEKKCLYAIKRYPNADIGLRELNGYLHFPALEVILGAVGKLKTNGLIEDKEAPFHGFQITMRGEDYIRKHKLTYILLSNAGAVLVSTFGSIVAGIVAGIVLHYLGFS